MGETVVFGKASSFLLAEGKRGLPKAAWFALSGLVLGLAAAVLGILWFYLSRPLPIPASPVLLLSGSPSFLKTLPISGNTLPPVLQHSNSKWPAIVGIYFDEGLWKYFVIGPNWMFNGLPKEQTVHAGLASIYYPDRIPTQTRNDTYTKQFTWGGFPSASFAFLLEPKLLFTDTGADSSAEGSIQGKLRNGILETNVPFQAKNQAPIALKTADFALQIPPDGNMNGSLYEVIRRLSNGRLDLTESPRLSEFHIWFDDQGRPANTIYTFSNDLTETDAANLLGSYGFSSTRTIILPDGTASTERIALTATTTDPLFGTRIDEQGEELDLTKRELRVNAGDSHSVEYPVKSACEPSQPWMRLSGKTLELIFTSLGWEEPPANIPAMQFGEKNGRLIACFE